MKQTVFHPMIAAMLAASPFHANAPEGQKRFPISTYRSCLILSLWFMDVLGNKDTINVSSSDAYGIGGGLI